ncbi:MAG: PAS domain-containing protein [Pseudanabaena sp. CRU_2_10]|nr:PAS domain-containing protein [Pseudanabaena sp. CRU_2_10]
MISNKPIFGGFILALLILGGAGIASYLNIKALTENKHLVEHTYQVLLSIDRIDDGLSEAERGKNRYIITSNTENLAIYQNGRRNANQAIAETLQLTIDKPIQQQHLKALQTIFQRRLANLQQAIALQSQQNQTTSTTSASQKALLKQGSQLQREVEALLAKIEKEERSLLKQRSLSTDRTVWNNSVLAGIGYLSSFMLLLAIYLLLQKQIRDRAATERVLSEANLLLETKIQERTAQLAKSTNHLRTIIDAEPDCLKTLDLNGKILEINASGLGILEADDDCQVIGQDVLPLIKPQFKDAYRQLFQQALLGKAGSIQAEIIAIKGTHRWVESHCVPLYDEQNQILQC